jgi:hypothetical protein
MAPRIVLTPQPTPDGRRIILRGRPETLSERVRRLMAAFRDGRPLPASR